MTSDDIYRILAPSEYKAVLERAGLHKRMQIETMLNTGMRYEELRRFGENPQWFRPKDREIKLPAASTKTIEARSVHLTPQFSKILEIYLASNDLKFPGRANMNKALSRLSGKKIGERVTKHGKIAIYDGWVNCKTFRKTWVTWLVFAQPHHLEAHNGTIYSVEDVEASMGHEHRVSTKHYQRIIGSLKNEVEAVKELTRGWMI